MLVIYLLIGVLAGTLSGMLGIGGGIVIIPALSQIFLHTKIVPPTELMHMAIGTSLAIVIATSISGLRAYQKRQSVRWDLVKQIAPTLLVGVLVGVVIANMLPSRYLQIIFGIFLVLISLKFLLEKNNHKIDKKLSRPMMMGLSFVIGMLCSILGLGGGVMLMPFLLHFQIDIRQAAGTSLACGMLVSMVATASFLLSHTGSAIPWSTGYIYWPAFMGVAAASILFAPVGTSLAHKLPTTLLKRIFAVLLMAMAIEMIL